VLDASVTLAWYIDQPVPTYAARVRRALSDGDRALVPALWRLEVPNGLVVAERRRLFTPSDTTLAVQKLEMLLTESIESTQETSSLHRVLSAARRYGLTAYDACYLELAHDAQLPLATLDRKLAGAARQAGVPLF
jgi:predicted nucleic acid-binding protein